MNKQDKIQRIGHLLEYVKARKRVNVPRKLADSGWIETITKNTRRTTVKRLSVVNGKRRIVKAIGSVQIERATKRVDARGKRNDRKIKRLYPDASMGKRTRMGLRDTPIPHRARMVSVDVYTVEGRAHHLVQFLRGTPGQWNKDGRYPDYRDNDTSRPAWLSTSDLEWVDVDVYWPDVGERATVIDMVGSKLIKIRKHSPTGA